MIIFKLRRYVEKYTTAVLTEYVPNYHTVQLIKECTEPVSLVALVINFVGGTG